MNYVLCIYGVLFRYVLPLMQCVHTMWTIQIHFVLDVLLCTVYCVHTIFTFQIHSALDVLCTVCCQLCTYNVLFRYTLPLMYCVLSIVYCVIQCPIQIHSALDVLCTVYCVLCTYNVLFGFTQPLMHCVLSVVYCVHTMSYLDSLSP